MVKAAYVILIVLVVFGLSDAKRRKTSFKTEGDDLTAEGRKSSGTDSLLNMLTESRAKNDDLQEELDIEKLITWKLKTENAVLNALLRLRTEELLKEHRLDSHRGVTVSVNHTSSTTSAPPPTTATTTVAPHPPPQPIVFASVACERAVLKLECQDAKVLKIVYANYGRTDGQNMCPSRFLRTTSCYANNTWNIVANRCQNQCKCSVNATNSVFGDPCVGTNKYLKVHYECV